MRVPFALLFAVAAATSLPADVTVRYNSNVNTPAATFLTFPAGSIDRISGLSGPTIIRIKGDKVHTSSGKMATVTDLASNQITYIDAEHQRFATATSGDLAKAAAAALPGIPPALGDAFKTELKSRKTGRTATIHGILTEETEYELAMTLETPNTPPGSMMRLVMQLWIADAKAASANAGLAELSRYSTRAASGMNPGEFIRQALGPFASLGESFATLQTEMAKNTAPVLRIHVDVYSPMMAILAPQGTDPSKPLTSFQQELTELNTDPVDESIFRTPVGYRQVPIDEILKDQATAVTGPAAGAPGRSVNRREGLAH